MTATGELAPAPLRHPDRFFIGGKWVSPSSDATITVTDSHSELPYFRVAEAQSEDIAHAVSAAREAFDTGPWPRLRHPERAEYLRVFAAGLRRRAEDIAQIWPRESGILASYATPSVAGAAATFDYYAGLADSYPFEEPATPTAGGKFGLLVREPVGVVGAIIPWNGPINLIANKVAPACSPVAR
jgi:acyl-CoA reductase-like NAD-dependent aldehyde dehydrogenase